MNSCFSFSNPQTSLSGRYLSRTSQVTIRAVNPSDLHHLTEVLMESFHPPNGFMCWTYPLLKLGIYEDIRSRLNRGSPHYLCLAAISGPKRFANVPSPASGLTQPQERLVGTIEMTLRTLGMGRERQSPYISNLAVCKSYRRQGIARQLLLGCEPTARDWGCRDIYLHVLEDNERAKQLYVSSGYRLHKIESSLATWVFNRPRRLLLHKSLS